MSWFRQRYGNSGRLPDDVAIAVERVTEARFGRARWRNNSCTDREIFQALRFSAGEGHRPVVAERILDIGMQRGGWSAYGAWWTLKEYGLDQYLDHPLSIEKLLDGAIDNLRKSRLPRAELQNKLREDVRARWRQRFPGEV